MYEPRSASTEMMVTEKEGTEDRLRSTKFETVGTTPTPYTTVRFEGSVGKLVDDWFQNKHQFDQMAIIKHEMFLVVL